jgi:hypothetical protein
MAAGDDSVIMAPAHLAADLIDACSTIWHFGDEAFRPVQIGLGQLGRDMKVQSQSMDFLSKRIITMCGKFQVTRKPERAILQSQITS